MPNFKKSRTDFLESLNHLSAFCVILLTLVVIAVLGDFSSADCKITSSNSRTEALLRLLSLLCFLSSWMLVNKLIKRLGRLLRADGVGMDAMGWWEASHVIAAPILCFAGCGCFIGFLSFLIQSEDGKLKCKHPQIYFAIVALSLFAAVCLWYLVDISMGLYYGWIELRSGKVPVPQDRNPEVTIDVKNHTN